MFNDVGDRKPDLVAVLSPAARVWLPVASRALIRSDVSTDFVWYRDQSSERSVDPGIDLRGEMYFRRVTVFAAGGLVSSRQRPNFEIDLRSRRDVNRVSGGIDIGITPRFSLELSASRSAITFDGDAVFMGTPLETTLNQKTTGFGGVTRYRLSPLTTFGLSVERFKDRFPLSPDRGTDNLRIMPGFDLRPRALISGSAYVGFRRLRPVDQARIPEFTGPVSALGLSYTLRGSTVFGVSHNRDIRYSFEMLQPYYVYTGLGARVRRALGPRFDAVIAADRYKHSYREMQGAAALPSAPQAVANGRVDSIWNYSASLGYRMGKSARVGFDISYWRRDSTTRGSRRSDGFHIGTSATHEF